LTTYGASIEYKDLKETLRDQEVREICFYGERIKKVYSIISIMRARKLPRQGYIGYLCYATKVKEEEMEIENILVVCEFLNV